MKHKENTMQNDKRTTEVNNKENETKPQGSSW
jgi:hypothetical protein